MNKLPENFSIEKYGLKVRLVNMNDATFILSLRSDPNRTKYMVTLDEKTENQKKWIQEYKKREKEGLDYYFIYSNMEEKQIGVNRISHVDYKEKTAKSSSWITVDGLIYEPFKMLVIHNEIAYNLLGIETIRSDVHKKNSRVIRFLKLFNYKFKDNETEYYYLTISKEEFNKIYDYRITKLLLHNL